MGKIALLCLALVSMSFSAYAENAIEIGEPFIAGFGPKSLAAGESMNVSIVGLDFNDYYTVAEYQRTEGFTADGVPIPSGPVEHVVYRIDSGFFSFTVPQNSDGGGYSYPTQPGLYTLKFLFREDRETDPVLFTIIDPTIVLKTPGAGKIATGENIEVTWRSRGLEQVRITLESIDGTIRYRPNGNNSIYTNGWGWYSFIAPTLPDGLYYVSIESVGGWGYAYDQSPFFWIGASAPVPVPTTPLEALASSDDPVLSEGGATFFRVLAKGGNGTYSYSWGGDLGGLKGGPDDSVVYGGFTPGTGIRIGTVTVTSGDGQSVTASIKVFVQGTPSEPVYPQLDAYEYGDKKGNPILDLFPNQQFLNLGYQLKYKKATVRKGKNGSVIIHNPIDFIRTVYPKG